MALPDPIGSGEKAAMQYVLDRLDEIYPLATKEVGFIADDEVTEDTKFPLGTTYNLIAGSDEEIFQGNVETLTFVLQLWDVRDREDALRDAVEALGVELNRNPTMDGTVRHTSIATRSVGERTTDGRSGAILAVVVEFKADNAEAGDTLIALIEDRQDDWTGFGATVTASPEIPGALQFFKSAAFPFATAITDEGNFPAHFPIDLSDVTQFRYMLKIPDNYRDDLTQIRLTLTSESLVDDLQFDTSDLVVGWNEIVHRIDEPTTVVGTIDLTAVNGISLAVFTPNDFLTTEDDPQFILDRIFYTARDKGANAVADSGF